MEYILELKEGVCVKNVEKMIAIFMTIVLLFLCITGRFSVVSYFEIGRIETGEKGIEILALTSGIMNSVEEMLALEITKEKEIVTVQNEVMYQENFSEMNNVDENIELGIDMIKSESFEEKSENVKSEISVVQDSTEEIIEKDVIVSEEVIEEVFDESVDFDEKEVSNETVNSETAFLIDDMGMIYGFRPEYVNDSTGYLELPKEGCVGIRRGTFVECTENIAEIRIPENIVNIEDGAITELRSLECIITDMANPVYMSKEGALFDRTGTSLIAYPPARVGAYFVPEYVRSVSENAFLNTSLFIIDVRGCGLSANCLLNISESCSIIE